MCRIYESFPDTQESTIYALLKELCKQEFTEPYKGEISDGPTRKYYRITKKGMEKRDALLREWHRLRDTLSTLGVE